MTRQIDPYIGSAPNPYLRNTWYSVENAYRGLQQAFYR